MKIILTTRTVTVLMTVLAAVLIASAQSAGKFSKQGDKLFEQQKYAEAAEAYKNAVAIKPDAVDFYNLGACYFNLGQYDKAADAYRQSLKLNPKDGDAREQLSRAEIEYRKLTNKSSADAETVARADALIVKGNAFFAAKDFKNAALAYEQSAALNPSALVYGNIGAAYQSLGKYDKAIVAYRQSLEFDPNNAQVKQYLADAQKLAAEKKEARAAFWNNLGKAVGEAATDNSSDSGGSSIVNQTSRQSNQSGTTVGGLKTGRYACGGNFGIIGHMRYEARPDMYILPGGRYKNLDNTGSYSYDPETREITWTSGALSGGRILGEYFYKGAVYVSCGKQETFAGAQTIQLYNEKREMLYACNLADN